MNKTLSFLKRIVKITMNNPRDLRVVFGTANFVAEEIENPESDVSLFSFRSESQKPPCSFY
jgi:hypothetical protein